MLPADTRWKVLVFLGSLNGSRLPKVKALAKELNEPTSFLRKYPIDGQIPLMFDIVSIALGDKSSFNYLTVPHIFRPHWSKSAFVFDMLCVRLNDASRILLDDTDVTGTQGGGAYERFGINTEDVTFVVVRPDGYVGMIAPSSGLTDLDEYFASFLIPPTLERRHLSHM